MLDRISGWIERSLGVPLDLQEKLLLTIALIAAYALAVRLARRIAARAIAKPESRYLISRASDYVFGFIGVALMLRIWVQGVTGMATYLGLLSAGIAFALQDPLVNLAGWLFIVTRTPFEIGDRVQIGQHIGDVVDIRIFQFTLLEIGNWVHADQSTGRVIHVPNGWVFKQSVANYDKGFRYIWQEIEVLVTFESDWRLAKEVLLKTVNDHAEHLTDDAMQEIEKAAERYHLKFSKLTPAVWTSVADSGIKLTLRYLCKPRERRSSQHEMWESILEAFEGLSNVELAYPTTRFYQGAVKKPVQAA